MDEVLLQKLTVHHKTSCNRRWVVTSQAERPSAHGGVWEIFLSLSVPGQRVQDWHRALLMKENGKKTPKTFLRSEWRCQGYEESGCLFIYNAGIWTWLWVGCTLAYHGLTTNNRLVTTYIQIICHFQTLSFMPAGQEISLRQANTSPTSNRISIHFKLKHPRQPQDEY